MLSASTSVLYLLFPESLSCQLRVRSFPSMRIWRPWARYFSQNSASLPKTTMLCHSVLSDDSRVLGLNNRSFVARVKLAFHRSC